MFLLFFEYFDNGLFECSILRVLEIFIENYFNFNIYIRENL